ncbi:MAG: sensor histidine kinase [Betaproteobacteria bacterium]|nr:sensor histidine kinase [Betaproteobacteria bacterium]
MLQRAIGNLLVNAIHHTPQHGSVALRVRQENGMAVLSIANSGAAIPADALETIFDRFVRLDQRSEGSGLGLAIARSAILAHGGKIEASASATTTEFTEFTIRLPLRG